MRHHIPPVACRWCGRRASFRFIAHLGDPSLHGVPPIGACLRHWRHLPNGRDPMSLELFRHDEREDVEAAGLAAVQALVAAHPDLAQHTRAIGRDRLIQTLAAFLDAWLERRAIRAEGEGQA